MGPNPNMMTATARHHDRNEMNSYMIVFSSLSVTKLLGNTSSTWGLTSQQVSPSSKTVFWTKFGRIKPQPSGCTL